jgi:hypothetical protein
MRRVRESYFDPHDADDVTWDETSKLPQRNMDDLTFVCVRSM